MQELQEREETAVPKMKDERVIKASSIHGKGEFAKKNIRKGGVIREISGARTNGSNIPCFLEPEKDTYLQIGVDEYIDTSRSAIGRSYINHSCYPNTFISIRQEGVFLVALRDIEEGEELTFDYSLTMDEDNWDMNCTCGAKQCMKRIRNFKQLPSALKQRYAKLYIVPEFLKKYL